MNHLALRGAIGVLVASLPWLNPFTFGPSAAAVPWFVSAGCGLALFALAVAGGGQRTHGALIACCAAVVGWAALGHLGRADGVPALAGALVLVVLVASAMGDPTVSRAMRQGLLAAALLSAAAGLIQYLGLSSPFAPWMNWAPAGDAYANLRQPNQFATLCWLGLAVLFWGVPQMKPRWAVAATILLATASASSVSRTGMLQGLLMVGLCILWRSPRRRENLQLCAIGFASYVAASLLLPTVLEWTTGALPSRVLWSRLSTSYGCSSRTVLWTNVLTLIAQRPFTGWGWGELDYAHFVTLYSGPRFCEILDNAHNLPLHLAVELGLPIAVLACAGGLVWCWRQRPWSEQNPGRQLAWAVLALILLHNMLEYPLWYGGFQIAFGAGIGWLLADTERAPAEPASHQLGATVVALVLTCVAGFAAWDYWRVSQIYLPPPQRREAWRDDPLGQARRSTLFSQQARFAELTLATVDRQNAAAIAVLARDMLHYSPEPRVVERLVEAETMLGHDREAVLDLARFRAAYPADYEAWRQSRGAPSVRLGRTQD